MDSLSQLFVQVVVVLLPGFVSFRLYYKLTQRGLRQTSLEDYLDILLFGLICYLLAAVLRGVFLFFWAIISVSGHDSLPVFHVRSLSIAFEKEPKLDFVEIVTATGLSIPVAFATAWLRLNKIINRIGRWFRVTKRFGNEDVWDYFLRSRDVSMKWIVVRDHKLDLVYFGYVRSFSESSYERELVLERVRVFSNTAGQPSMLYRVEALYVSRLHHDLSLELPMIEESLMETENLTPPRPGVDQ